MYPKSELAKNQVPNEEQLMMVERAVLQYKEQTNGLVPIKTKSNDVAKYEKYLIDFSLLKEKQLISEIPSTAYENGGYYQYVIIDPEDNLRVKLIDLRVTEKIRELNFKLDLYRQENIYPPFGEQITDHIYSLNYKKLGLKERPTVTSPYSKEQLPLLITTDGEIIVDYRIDLQLALEQFKSDIEDGEDILFLLEEHYPFVPAYSVDYTIENGQPIFND